MNKAFTLIATLLALCSCGQKAPQTGYPIGQVPFTDVKVSDPFWGARLQASREVTIPLAFSKCEETGRYDNFVRATQPDSTYRVGGFPFDDTDVYKTIEGASYLLQTQGIVVRLVRATAWVSLSFFSLPFPDRLWHL